MMVVLSQRSSLADADAKADVLAASEPLTMFREDWPLVGTTAATAVDRTRHIT